MSQPCSSLSPPWFCLLRSTPDFLVFSFLFPFLLSFYSFSISLTLFSFLLTHWLLCFLSPTSYLQETFARRTLGEHLLPRLFYAFPIHWVFSGSQEKRACWGPPSTQPSCCHEYWQTATLEFLLPPFTSFLSFFLLLLLMFFHSCTHGSQQKRELLERQQECKKTGAGEQRSE